MALQLYARKKGKDKYRTEMAGWTKDIQRAMLRKRSDWYCLQEELVPVEIRELPVAPKKGK